MKEGRFVSTHELNVNVVDKPEKDWSKEDKENVQCGLKAKNIIIIALDIDVFLRVSHCETPKEMWDILQVTHECTTEVKRERLGTLTHEYELFIMQPEENIS